MRRLSGVDPGSVYPESVGEDVARQVFTVLRVSGAIDGQVLRKERSAVLQG